MTISIIFGNRYHNTQTYKDESNYIIVKIDILQAIALTPLIYNIC